jgi:hypothetical protein
MDLIQYMITLFYAKFIRFIRSFLLFWEKKQKRLPTKIFCWEKNGEGRLGMTLSVVFHPDRVG